MRKINLSGILLTVALGVVLFFALTRRFGDLGFESSTLAPGLSALADVPLGYDPLTAPEADAVVAAALQTEGQSAQSSALTDQQELLLVERREAFKTDSADGDWQRQGDVYIYDYASDTLIHNIVDVASGAVITVERVQGVQLPLTEREEQRALDIIQADDTLWTVLTERYQSLADTPLRGFDQLQTKVSLFRADAMPDHLNAAAKQCGQHRCAQVLIFSVERTLLDLTPIVDLSLGQVVQVLEPQ